VRLGFESRIPRYTTDGQRILNWQRLKYQYIKSNMSRLEEHQNIKLKHNLTGLYTD